MTAQSVVTLLHSHALFLVRMGVHVVTAAVVNCVSAADGTQLELWQSSVLGKKPSSVHLPVCGRANAKRDGTRAETRIGLSAKRTSPFQLAGGGQFSQLLAVEECGVWMQDDWLPTPFASFPFTSSPVRLRVPSDPA